MDTSKKVVELEKVSFGDAMVPKLEMDVVKGDMRLLQEKMVILERKLTGNQCLEEEISLLQGKVASLELEKLGHVDKFVMLEQGVQKSK